MNHSVLVVMGADPAARAALAEYVAQPGSDQALCVKGTRCKPWKKTKDGQQRAARIRERLKENKSEA